MTLSLSLALSLTLSLSLSLSLPLSLPLPLSLSSPGWEEEDELASGVGAVLPLLAAAGFRRRGSGLAEAALSPARCLNWKRVLGVILAASSFTLSVRALMTSA